MFNEQLNKPPLVFSVEPQSLNELRGIITKHIGERSNLIQNYCSENGISGDAKKVFSETFDFVRKNTTPIMMFIESMADFCEALDNISALVFDRVFSLAQSRNIYVVACFEPNDYQRVENRSLYYGFNEEMTTLLLGGRFNEQKVCVLPDVTGMNNGLPYNLGLISYQNRIHPISIPCGVLTEEEIDEDDQSIF